MFVIDLSPSDTFTLSNKAALTTDAKRYILYVDSCRSVMSTSQIINAFTSETSLRGILFSLTNGIPRTDFPSFADSLTTVTNNLSGINEGDRRKTLGAISVAYRSWIYWICVLPEVEGLVVKSKVSDHAQAIDTSKVIGVVNADLGGFMTGGFATGMAVGAWTAGLGAVLGFGVGAAPGFAAGFSEGFVAGGIGGAIASSADYASKPATATPPAPKPDSTCKCNCCKVGKKP